MELAYEEALKDYKKNEIPVWAIIELNGEVISKGHNLSISEPDPTAHAEIIALRKAAEKLQNYRLNGASMYVTLEPCYMCAAAIVHSRIDNLVFAAIDEKTGAVVSQGSYFDQSHVNHKVSYSQGELIKESSDILRKFFEDKRS
jgi:tRNA(adenine34) deaminase